LSGRLAWAVVPLVLTSGKCLLWALTMSVRAETWTLPGSFALLAALVALSPPTPWWRFHALRVATYVLCWLPMLLSELGLYVMVAIAPFLQVAAIASNGDFQMPVSSGRLEVVSAVMLSLFGALWVTASLAAAASHEGMTTMLLLWSGSMGLALAVIGLGGLASLGRVSRPRG
jgi:hypothetical protein